jgi:glycosyltransferase involved in cell wall biosynthesis
MSKKYKISVILPNLQEESIFKVIKEIKELLKNEDYEIIVVNKSDKAYLNRLKKAHVKIIEQKVQKVESAIMLGMSYAKGDIIVSTDADGTHDSNGIKAGIKLIKGNKADFVLGNRFANLTKGSMSPHLIIGNKIISNVYSIVYKKKIHDVLTGLFVMNRKAYESIKNIEPYKAGIAFFAIEVAKKGFRVAEVPISYYPREYGKSKLAKSKIWYGLNVVTHIIRTARDYSPLLIFGGIGVILFLIGSGLGVFVIWNYLTTGAFTVIGRALISFMLLITGILSIMVGFILDLLLEILKKLEK